MTDGQDLLRQIASAGTRIDPALSDRDVERLVEGARRRRRQRTLRRLGLASAAAGAAIFAVVMIAHRLPDPAKPVAVAPHRPVAAPLPVADRTLRLLDGSSATPLDTGSVVEIIEQSADRVLLSLVRGRARFEVTPRSQRTFSVRAGEVTVTVVGTVFTVERIADRVGVVVERGTVRVDWGAGTRLLQKGESGWFPPLLVGAPNEPRVARSAQGKAAKAKSQVAGLEAEPALPVSPKGEKSESAENLLLAADSARLMGHPDRGADLLKRLLREHRADPRAPLAAFTLGRVLLMELGRPREAAAAFAEVRQLAPQGSFAEDALAREVEAWSQAGQPELARDRAREYLRLYPGGRRAATVRSMGGME